METTKTIILFVQLITPKKKKMTYSLGELDRVTFLGYRQIQYLYFFMYQQPGPLTLKPWMSTKESGNYVTITDSQNENRHVETYERKKRTEKKKNGYKKTTFCYICVEGLRPFQLTSLRTFPLWSPTSVW